MLSSSKIFDLVDQFIAVIEKETSFPVLIYDTDGRIIRATDKSRIGDLHAGAQKIMQQLVDGYAVTAEEAAQNPLVREGYSCPIYMDGEIVAGFGITGKLALSEPLAKIAVSMIHSWIEKQTYQEQLERSERKYRNIFDNSQHGIFQATMEGQFLTANTALARAFGYESPRALMAYITDIANQLYVDPDDRRKFLSALQAKGNISGFITRFKRQDGQVIDVSINAQVMHDADTNEPYIEGFLEDISEKRKSEEAVRQSEEKYFKAFNNSPVWVVLSAFEDGRYIEVNETFLQATGYTREQVIGRTAIEIHTWNDLNDRLNVLEALKTHGKVRNYEVKRRTRTGDLLTMLFSAEVIEISGETRILSASLDISDRKQIEERLRLSENNLKITLQSIGDGVITTDETGLITRMNPAAERLTGWTSVEAEGRPLFEIFHILDTTSKQRIEHDIDRIMEKGATTGLASQALLMAKDGRKYQIANSGAPMRSSSGEAVGVVLVFRDITESHAQAQRIEQSERLLKNVTANLPGVVYQFHATRDHRYSVRYMSSTIKTYFGIDGPLEDMFDAFYACIPEEEKAAFIASIQKAVDEKHTWHYEGRFIKPEGQRIWFTGHSVPQEEGEDLVFYGVLLDVTERKMWERSLANSERRFKELFNDAPVMYVITENRDNRPYIQDANALFADTLGYRKDEIIGTPLAQYYADASRHELLEGGGYEKALKGQFSAEERNLVTREGRHIHTLLHALPEYDVDGNVRGTRAMFLDISARKQAEEEAKRLEAALIQAQKMEAIGTLAGGIAHDFNNILSAVIGYSQLSLAELSQGSRLHHNLEQILTAGMRAGDLVNQILTFSRQHDRELLPIQVGPIVKEALKMLRATLPATIDIDQDIAAEMDNVMADSTQIQQIVMNLSTNAAHAMETSGGTLTVCVSQVDMAKGRVDHPPELGDGIHIRIDVQDTGTGMTEEMMAQIFNPYFTTKEMGKGTGLGLSVVHGIVKSYDGAIVVKSKPGHGTTFSVYIPAITREKAPEKEAAAALPTGTERVMLVDDEPLLIDIGTRILELLGYTVTTCQDGLEALNLFRSKPEDIDMVISDVTMPGMTGDVLAVELLKIDSSLPIILCTGFSDKMSEEQAGRIGVKGFLRKPIVAEDLAHMVRNVLSQGE